MMGILRAFALTVAFTVVLAACSKEETPVTSTAETAEPAQTAVPPTPAASASTLATASTSATTVPPATTSAAALATPAAKGSATCGDKPMPPCPLAAWMKANTSPAMTSRNYDALAAALEKTATFAPAGYTNWVSISKDGADAARAQSFDGVKGACRGCHNQYKDKYKKEMRDRPI
jgi:hypothetical protein